MEPTDPRAMTGNYPSGGNTAPLLRGGASDPRRITTGAEAFLAQLQPSLNSLIPPNNGSDHSMLTSLATPQVNNPASGGGGKSQQQLTSILGNFGKPNGCPSPALQSNQQQSYQPSIQTPSMTTPYSPSVTQPVSNYNYLAQPMAQQPPSAPYAAQPQVQSEFMDPRLMHNVYGINSIPPRPVNNQLSDGIYVSGLPKDVTIEKLASYFGEFGQLRMDRHKDPPQPSIQIIHDPITHQPKGEARVVFETPELARKAVEYFQGKHWAGHGQIRVDLSATQDDFQHVGVRPPLSGGMGIYYREPVDYNIEQQYRRTDPGPGGDYYRDGFPGYDGGGGVVGNYLNRNEYGGRYGCGNGSDGGFLGGGGVNGYGSSVVAYPPPPGGDFSGQQGAPVVRGGFRGRGGSPREGDWICPECGNMNFSWRTECKQCGITRPTHAQIVRSGSDVESVRNDYMPHAGDWTCVKCSFKNFARRDTCHRCKADKSYSFEAGGGGGIARDSISERRSDRRERPY